ncbi:cytochrome d ubiquinol oxidase subunit II [Zymomonas mobilis subsp. mobilis ZM4 = ATCC 31821]|uniref:Cytochrome d ubiquinol oxidase, subunit II n=3 Tax=Zymomonas mobilis TaxID=542 RepID=H2VFN0_ZYMMO|nr:cytochrome d ubiquinol oxidase subunit II [Zymomonas mobilis]AAF18273.1 cytochrome oxidase D subunit B [Zymomonas mobilis subsp. mobilis ZM4 = ATCC 31821]AAV90196.1 cytochrome d ubiquinol oxidase, subunit II [Zymomonas mobilis subsp. mobilis ZM4 = ATCC 31821]ACV76173.1 cytochrome d ubiquinol oxidase, subunit II [Zymomonas mobilis subsp. mobilis NCIMB 11163]AEH63377.1 cytochrome d ubiquinol oxidase, subunit II [Zymomonas mobilis subsp. mobilis ATCC 10988]AFN57393.1 cytochrome d ubiquinol oxi
MTATEYWLPVVWACLAAVGILIYVVLDGFDLGIGILFATQKDEKHRDVMMNTIAPVWDGNETWMVFGGAVLLGAFQTAYSVILPALYLPLIVMLLALIFRGVAFEYRVHAHSKEARCLWGAAFMGGSTLATFCQGMVLGGLLQGIKTTDHHFTGSALDWLNPFSIFCGVALVIGYGLLGAGWLIWRTEGELQAYARRAARCLGSLLLVCIAVVAVWTPMLRSTYLNTWTNSSSHAVAAVVLAVLAVLVSVIFFRSLKSGKDRTPFLCALGWFILSYLGLALSAWPYIVPPYITIWQASSPVTSQTFLLVGTVILLPLVLAYTIYCYKIFHGKVTSSDGYH